MVPAHRRGYCWRYRQSDPIAPGIRVLKLCDVDARRRLYRLHARVRHGAGLPCLNAPCEVGLTIGNSCDEPCDHGAASTTTTIVTTTTTTTTGVTTTSTTLPDGCGSVSGSPSAVASEGPNAGDWFWPQDAITEDGRTAIVRLGHESPSSYLVTTGFGFALPPTVQVTGITVTVTRAARDPGSIRDFAVRLTKDGAVGAGDRSRPEFWDSSYSRVEYGGSSDLWGEAWSPSDVNSLGFGAVLRTEYTDISGNNDAGVDAMRVTVHYCR